MKIKYKLKARKLEGKKEVRRAKKPKKIKKTKVLVFFLIRRLILYLHLHLQSLYNLYLAAFFPIYLLYYTVILNNKSKARSGHCQDCGLGI